ncbi:MAG: hypothetical protein VKJ64_21955 [Leptolyngbyaceae bacterium]|nr:hypothetical protein [Leptolyngbyaceae bacterium]
MTPKQELIEELATAPSPIVKEVLNFLRFLKAKQTAIDFMDFAGMASDTPDLIDKIIADSEVNRAMDLERTQNL